MRGKNAIRLAHARNCPKIDLPMAGGTREWVGWGSAAVYTHIRPAIGQLILHFFLENPNRIIDRPDIWGPDNQGSTVSHPSTNKPIFLFSACLI